MGEASWKGELVDEAGGDEAGGVGDSGQVGWVTEEAGLPDRWRVWPGSEVTFARAVGGKGAEQGPCRGTCRSGGRKW